MNKYVNVVRILYGVPRRMSVASMLSAISTPTEVPLPSSVSILSAMSLMCAVSNSLKIFFFITLLVFVPASAGSADEIRGMGYGACVLDVTFLGIQGPRYQLDDLCAGGSRKVSIVIKYTSGSRYTSPASFDPCMQGPPFVSLPHAIKKSPTSVTLRLWLNDAHEVLDMVTFDVALLPDGNATEYYVISNFQKTQFHLSLVQRCETNPHSSWQASNIDYPIKPSVTKWQKTKNKLSPSEHIISVLKRRKRQSDNMHPTGFPGKSNYMNGSFSVLLGASGTEAASVSRIPPSQDEYNLALENSLGTSSYKAEDFLNEGAVDQDQILDQASSGEGSEQMPGSIFSQNDLYDDAINNTSFSLESSSRPNPLDIISNLLASAKVDYESKLSSSTAHTTSVRLPVLFTSTSSKINKTSEELDSTLTTLYLEGPEDNADTNKDALEAHQQLPNQSNDEPNAINDTVTKTIELNLTTQPTPEGKAETNLNKNQNVSGFSESVSLADQRVTESSDVTSETALFVSSSDMVTNSELVSQTLSNFTHDISSQSLTPKEPLTSQQQSVSPASSNTISSYSVNSLHSSTFETDDALINATIRTTVVLTTNATVTSTTTMTDTTSLNTMSTITYPNTTTPASTPSVATTTDSTIIYLNTTMTTTAAPTTTPHVTYSSTTTLPTTSTVVLTTTPTITPPSTTTTTTVVSTTTPLATYPSTTTPSTTDSTNINADAYPSTASMNTLTTFASTAASFSTYPSTATADSTTAPQVTYLSSNANIPDMDTTASFYFSSIEINTQEGQPDNSTHSADEDPTQETSDWLSTFPESVNETVSHSPETVTNSSSLVSETSTVNSESDTFWPIVAALVIGIPSVIVFGIAITVIYRRRLTSPPRLRGTGMYPSLNITPRLPYRLSDSQRSSIDV